MVFFVALEAHTDRPRTDAIANVLAVLGAEGGFVTGTEQLGGLALMLRIELPPAAARSLDARLASHGIRLEAASRAAIDEAVAGSAEGPLVGSLHLRFFARESDVKIEIPKVPG